MAKAALRIAGLAAGHGAVDFYIPVVPALLPALIPLFESQGITSYAMSGLIFTTVTVMMVIFQPLIGLLIDKNKWTPSTSVCVILTGVGIAAFGLTQNYWALIIFAVIVGFANSAYHPNAYRQIHQFTTSSNRGLFMSLMSAGGTFGYAAAPLATGALFAWGGFPAVVCLLIPGLVVGVILFKLPQHPLKETEAERAEAVVSRPNYKGAALMLGISSLRSWVYYGFIAFGVEYLSVYAGVDYVLSTAVISSMIFAGMCGTLIIGPLSDKVGRKEMMILAYIGGALGYAGIFIFSGIASVVSLVVAGFFLMATASVEIAAVQELMPGSVGFASGIVIGIPQGMAAVSMVVVGILADFFGMTFALPAQVTLLVVAVVLCLALPYPLKLLKRKKVV